MQGDLISRTEVINLLCRLHINNIAGVTECIKGLPTAYDVEKVVEDVMTDCFSMGFDESQAEIIVADIRNGGKE